MNKRKLADGIEYRNVLLGDTGVSDTGNLHGIAVRYGSPTQIGDPSWGWKEHFAAGAFTASLSTRDVVLLDNHDSARPLARASAGTLQLREGTELSWDAQPVDTTYAADVKANVRAGNYGGCSFGFIATREAWFDDDGNPSNAWDGTVREVQAAELHEVSVCTFPAYTDTEVGMRSADILGRRQAIEERQAAAESAALSNGETIAGDDGNDSSADTVDMRVYRYRHYKNGALI